MYCLQGFIKYARKNNATRLHPENLSIPKGAAKSKKTTLQKQDIKILFTAENTTRYGKPVKEWFLYAYRFAVITGLRPGELAGLKDDDIAGNTCVVNRAINKYDEVTTGKNDNAKRTFTIPQIGMQVLAEQRQALKRAKIISPHIFPAMDGTHLSQNVYYKRWVKYRDTNGISKTTPYEMRHTFFSINKEMPVELLKRMGGHSKDFDTFGVYGHEIDGDSERTATMINDTITKLLK